MPSIPELVRSSAGALASSVRAGAASAGQKMAEKLVSGRRQLSAGIGRQAGLLFGGRYVKHLKPGDMPLSSHIKGLVANPARHLADSAYHSSNLQKGAVAAMGAQEIPELVSGNSAGERGAAGGRLLGTVAGGLTFRKAGMLQDLLGTAALAGLGGKAVSSVAEKAAG